MGRFGTVTENIYSVDENGNIVSTPKIHHLESNNPGDPIERQTARINGYSQASYNSALAQSIQVKTDKLQATYEKRLADVTSQENTYNSLASQIKSLTGGESGYTAGGTAGPAGPGFNQALAQLSAARNYGSSDLGTMLNFQVSDQQIVDDYNNSRTSKLDDVIKRGNTQIAGIQERLNTANELVAGLPVNDPRRTSSNVFIKQLNDDLKSVTSAVTEAQDMQKNFKPITTDSPEGLKEITSFRTFAQLPEERASQQLYQIDPESYKTAVGLGQQYRQMATQPIGDTVDLSQQRSCRILDQSGKAVAKHALRAIEQRNGIQ